MDISLNYIRFDVGHYLYVCHRNTLQKFQNSVLAKYVSPDFDKRKSGSEYIVIDRDGKHFGSILNFMRDQSSLDLKQWNNNDLTDLMREADFYCLTELVELCEHEFEQRDILKRKQKMIDKDCVIKEQQYNIPPNCRIEIILGLQVGRELLSLTKKPTIVISHQNVRKYHIDSWIEELVRLCDHDKFNVYSFADRSQSDISPEIKLTLRDFIVALYEPQSSTGRFTLWVSAPPYDKFRARRAHYKCKIFKFWFLVQNDMAYALKRRTCNN